ncbi:MULTISPECIES: hypothetical protein [unclassified Gilliamella]|uniref:hypothetical protein n=1 Tax=unclassified Gilliamella TaxID=2685620 RepID=UPI001327B9AD|nr:MULTISPECIES: hypothetical protein [unclassified Gilliamella]MWN31637.1 hypothetical protein [Gilliamella sp. Pra-s60]MWP28744.1 hypothetical protein [Gilliamella sp. Pra-s54]
MFGLLKNLLFRKKQKPLTERDLNGRNHVGYPTMQLSGEIDKLIEPQFKSIKPVIKMYKETLFFKWGPGVINDKLSDDQLAKLSGRNLQMVYLLLFRDMLRHIAEIVELKNEPANWPDIFAQKVLDNCQMLGDADDTDIAKKQALFASEQRYSVDIPIDDKHPENTEIPDWAVPLAELIMLPADMIYKCHRPLLVAITARKKRR